MRSKVALTAVLVSVLVGAEPGYAGITGSGSATPNFADGVERVVIVTEVCEPSVDCSRLESLLFVSVTKMKADKPFSVVHPRISQDTMVRSGVLGYEPSRRFEIAKSVDADALLVLRVENAEAENRVGLLGLASKSNIKVGVHLHRLADDRVVFQGRAQGQLPVGGGSPEPALQFAFDKIFSNPRVENAFQGEADPKADPGYRTPPELAVITEPAAEEEGLADERETEEPAYIVELRALDKLRDQGVITDGEFEQKKRQLLGLEE